MEASKKLFGRDSESARLDDLLGGLPRAGGAVIVRGDPGIGKTALGEFAIGLARRRNIPVLSTNASEVEAQLPFAALEKLLRPYIKKFSLLRPRQREALEAALGLSRSSTPDVYLVGLAVLDLLSEVGGDTGVLVVIDDVHWIDASTAQALGFVIRRLRSEPVAMVVTVRPGYPTPLLETDLPIVDLEALSESDSLSLMAESRSDLGRLEQLRVLDLARGNPLALLELPPAIARSDETVTHVMTERLHRAFRMKLSELSEPATVVLLIAAASDGDLVGEVIDAARSYREGIEVTEEALDELAATGELSVEGDILRFRHPLVRSAIIESSADAAIRAAHGALARTLAHSTDRAAWHLAASVVGPDERAGAELESVADRAQAQGNPAVMLRALTLAARLSVHADSRARRLLRAAESAIELGQGDRAGEIAHQVDTASLSAHDEARLALLRNSLDSTAHTAARVARLVSHSQDALTADDFDLAVALL
ncbi:MAG TPA: AAA family ATPase, partial [Galbitalea sp.]